MALTSLSLVWCFLSSLVPFWICIEALGFHVGVYFTSETPGPMGRLVNFPSCWGVELGRLIFFDSHTHMGLYCNSETPNLGPNNGFQFYPGSLEACVFEYAYTPILIYT